MEGLPSERSSMSGASKLLGRLADRASAEIVFPYSNLEWQRRKYQEALRAGREPEMTYAVRPGAFVERLGPEDREVLAELRSEDAGPARIDPRFLDFPVVERGPRVFGRATST